MLDESLNLENPSDEQLGVLRRNAGKELERISVEEFAARLKAPLEDLLRFLQGARPDRRLLRGLAVYDYEPYPDLALLMAGRFYESYDYDTGSFESWEPAVDDFARGETRGRVAGVAIDIKRLLSDVDENDRILEILKGLGCRFAFDAIELTPREWLRAIHDRLLSHAGLHA